MDTRQLLKALGAIQNDYTRLKVPSLLADLAAKAEAVSTNPADSDAQTAFTNTVTTVRNTLKQARSRNLPISVRKTLDDASLSDLIVPNIISQLENILHQAPFVFATATTSLKGLAASTANSWKNAQTIINSLNKAGMSVDSSQISPYEVGILMPTSFTHDDLYVFRDQITQWTRIIEGLEELATGKTPDKIQVSGLSKGSFDLFVALAPLTTWGLAMLATGVVKALQVRVDTDSEAERLKEKGYANSIIEAIRNDAPNLVDRIKEETINAIFDFIKPKGSNSRSNPREFEIKAKLNFGFDFALKSANRGVDVEVSTPQDVEESKEGEEAVQALHQKIKELEAELQKRTKELPDRTEPLISLPPPTLQDDQEGKAS